MTLKSDKKEIKKGGKKMKYIVVERTQYSGGTEYVNTKHNADTLDNAIKYKTALEMLPHDKDRVSFDILISIKDTFAYIKECEGDSADKKVINF